MNLKDGGWVDLDDPYNTQFNYVEPILDQEYFDAFLNMYLLSLGEFYSLDGYKSGYNAKSATLMFILATIFLLLLFMNMIIAVMSEPFEEVRENKLAH